MSWKSDFGADYKVPENISSQLTDMSYKNDVSPSFGIWIDDDNEIRIWVEHPIAEEREFSYGNRMAKRYIVTGKVDGEEMWEEDTDNSSEALRIFRRYVKKMAAEKAKQNPIPSKGSREVPLFVTQQPKKKNPSRRAPRYSIALVKERGSLYVTSKPINSPKLILQQLQELFENTDREAFYVVCLDQKLKIIGINMVSTGTLTASLVHPREVHNHPSGDPNPSRQDRELSDRLKEAGTLLGIRLQDMIVVGDDRYYSFVESGIL